MKRVITYGTFDLFHEGHFNILKRAKQHGDYLIVGVTSDNYDRSRGKLNVKQSLMERIENVKKSGFADEIIVEEFLGQKIEDIKKYKIDKFVIGSDWAGKFDYLKEFCEVIYLDRTKGISSTQLRNSETGIVNIGIVGAGRIAKRFCKEALFVSGINVDSVFGRNENKLKEFIEENGMKSYFLDYDKFLDAVDAVYVASPNITHYEYIKYALEQGKHVLTEKPMVLRKDEAVELYNLASKKGLVLFEAIKTVYTQAFKRLVSIAKSGMIGQIKDIDATFTKLMFDKNGREFDIKQMGGSVTELASYPLIAIIKLLGTQYEDIKFYSFMPDDNVDEYTKIVLKYKNAIATAQIGLGVKKEGELVVSGTKGYIYVPAPWWKTEYFEVRFENQQDNEKHFYKFNGDGLRYEIAEFLNSIRGKEDNISLKNDESIATIEIIEKFLNKENIEFI